MKILLAPDKFKSSLSAKDVCSAMQKGFQTAWPDASCIAFPLADGGEGTFEILTHHSGGTVRQSNVLDPLLRPRQAKYGVSGDGNTAFIEMAQASGLHLLMPTERNCLYTSTWGTGQLISDAIDRGVSEILIGVGGSATCEGGIGMAAALGYGFLDKNGRAVTPIGKNLSDIAYIQPPSDLFLQRLPTVRVACDVDNPLYGPQGATYVYGPQKGASLDDLPRLDEGLQHLAFLIDRDLGMSVADIPGAGAAGGLAAGLMAFLHAKLTGGFDLVAEYTQLADVMSEADWIVTGEGKVDRQTLQGKVVAGVCKMAKQYGKPVVILAGTIEDAWEVRAQLDIAYLSSIVLGPCDLEGAISQAAINLEYAAYNLAGLIVKAKKY